ncbi:MAG: endonuclease III [Actinomycetota bacterium]|nr:endonuclease III [Actinomycetota bacterium]
MIEETDFKAAMRIIIGSYEPVLWSEKLTPFEILVSVVISQATERRGNIRAFKNLKNHFMITPANFSEMDEGELAELIKPAGLHRNKAKKLKETAEVIMTEYEGDLAKIFEPISSAKEKLVVLPGVGVKTADVMLALVGGVGLLPVDTHIARIAKRLPLVDAKASYEEIKAAYERWTPPKERPSLHMALIEHGRDVCKSRRPRCEICPIRTYCGRVGLT